MNLQKNNGVEASLLSRDECFVQQTRAALRQPLTNIAK